MLSGGEKVRLSLCKILYNKPNFLILDEPTNHLDLIGKEQLERILSSYKGTILFVSHDRYFTNKIATRLIIFDEKGATNFYGNYEEWMKKQPNMTNTEKKQEKNLKKTKEIQNEKKNLKERIQLEKQINRYETKKQELTKELYKEENFSDYQKMNELKRKVEEITNQLTALEEEWFQQTDIENEK